ncbi:hypothetical protein [Nocardia callitridis]|uniref:hypothetical protein n=1 Tax=Nocardia callitridis TaxID=648753 RepID=UPI0031EDF5CD
MKPRRSTAILIATWLAMFVLYMFVRPDHSVAAGQPAPQPASAVVDNTTPAPNSALPGH